MSDEIRIAFTEVEQAIIDLEAALENFVPYSNSFSEQTALEINEFQSDFIDRIEDVLDSISDSESPKLIENIRDFIEGIKIYKGAFEYADQLAGTKIE